MTELFTCSGTLSYSNGPPYRLTVDVDQNLGDYYRSLLPKYFNVSPSRHPTHITVVRIGKDNPPHLQHWGKYQGERVNFFYEPGVRKGKVYFWLRALSTRLEDIRLELGLPVEVSFDPSEASYTKPPAGFRKYFHITVGNCKT